MENNNKGKERELTYASQARFQVCSALLFFHSFVDHRHEPQYLTVAHGALSKHRRGHHIGPFHSPRRFPTMRKLTPDDKLKGVEFITQKSKSELTMKDAMRNSIKEFLVFVDSGTQAFDFKGCW